MCKAAVRRLLPALTILCGIVCGTSRAGGPSIVGDSSSLPLECRSLAIMGEVARPGVYEVEEPRLPLLELVNRAGGATPLASGNVRIIRDGKAGEQTFLSPELKYELLPNDLVILDSWQSRSIQHNSARLPQEPAFPDSEGSPGTAAAATIQIGLVNLIARPVILNITLQEARLGTVLSLLRQSPDDIGELTVIKPLAGAESIYCDEAADMSLASGNILVFDQTTVEPDKLPPLPPTIGAPGATAPPAPEPAAPRESIPQALTRMQAQAKRASPTGAPVEEFEVETASRPAAPAEASNAREPALLADSGRAGEEQQPAASHTGWLLLIGAAVPGGVAFAVSRWRSRRQARPNFPAAVPSERDGAGTLQLLISNALPIVEEPVRLPTEATIFGRPRLDSPHRFDTAHALHGPHYAVEPATPAAQPRDASRASDKQRSVGRRQEIDEMQAVCPPEPARRPPIEPPLPVEQGAEPSPREDDAPARILRVDRAHPRSSPGTLDRALAIFEERRP